MFEQEASFIDLALSGDVLLSEIDDFVDRWHDNGGDETLREYLGMTEIEYDLWLSEPDWLAHIVKARHDQVSLSVVVQNAVNDNESVHSPRIAARTDQTAKVDRLKQWLEREGFDLT